jgi:hypothetical protein
MRSPIASGLDALALACVAAALTTRALSSGTGQAILVPGSVLVLDAVGATAALAALGGRFLDREPALIPDRGVLAPLGVFLALALGGALHGANGAWRTFFSWAALAALGLAVRDLARRRDVARALAGLVAGLGAAAAALGLYDFFFELPAARLEVEAHKGSFPIEMLYRVEDPMATGPFLLPSHFACALAMTVPLLLVALHAFAAKKKRLPAALTGLLLALALLAMALARSKGAWLALGAGLLAFLALADLAPVWRRRLVGAVVAALGLGVAAGLVQYVRHPGAFGVGNSTNVRVEYARAALSMAREHPLLGNGLDTYAELYGQHKVAAAEEARHAHCDPVELLAELGVLAPLAFFALVFALGRAGLRALRSPEVKGPLPARPFAPEATIATGIALGGIMLVGHGDVYDHSRSFAILAGATIAVAAAKLVGRALEEPVWAQRAAAAALAGALVFVVDGLTDFPLRVHGLVAFAFALAFLAPALAEGPTSPPPATPAKRLAVGLPLFALLLFGLVHVREETAADELREGARDMASSALGTLHAGKRLSVAERDELEQRLDGSAEGLRRLLEANELGVPEVLLLVDVQEAIGRLEHDDTLNRRNRLDGIRKELADALVHFPHSRELWHALGRLQADANLFADATASFDAAARCYPTNPHGRLDAAVVRVARIAAGEPGEKLRDDALHELHAALVGARTSRLERLHLSDAEIAAARGFQIALGVAPEWPRGEEPEPPVR